MSSTSRQIDLYRRNCTSVTSDPYGPKLRIGGKSVNTNIIPRIPLPSITSPSRRDANPHYMQIPKSLPSLSSDHTSDATLSIQSGIYSRPATPQRPMSIKSNTSVFATNSVSNLGAAMNLPYSPRPLVVEPLSNTTHIPSPAEKPVQQRGPIRVGSIKGSRTDNKPRLASEIDRIADNVSKDTYENDAKKAKPKKSAYEIGDMYDAGRPDFANMSRNERLVLKQTLIQELRDLRFKYPELAIPEINHELTVEEMYDIHYAALRHIVVKQQLTTWKMGLVICWAAFELICVKGFNIPAEGYTQVMYDQMIRYEILIYRWREKKFTFATAESDPLNEILWCSLLNAGIIIAVNMIGRYLGSDIVKNIAKSIAIPIANHVAHPKVNIPGVPNPTNEGGLLGAVEGGIMKVVSLFSSPSKIQTSADVKSSPAANPPPSSDTKSQPQQTAVAEQPPIIYDT